MELDDLKAALQAMEDRLDRHLDAQWAALRLPMNDAVRRALRPAWLGLALRLLAGVVLVGMASAYWVPRWQVPHLLVCGLSLHAFGLLLIATAAREMFWLRPLDGRGSVLDEQRRLAALALWRVRLVRVWAVAGGLVWVPALVALFDAGLGADLWQHAPAAVVAMAAGGLAAALAILTLRRHLPAAGAHIDRNAVGSPLRRAQAVVEEVARFTAA